MKKTSPTRKAAKAAKPVTKPAPAKAKAKTSVAAPVVVIHQKVRREVSSTFRLPADLKEALISHSFSAGYNGNMSAALCSILRQTLG
jgi:hypothetical protein